MERRTLIKGAVWSVPIIAAATAAPHIAASAPTRGIRFNGTPKHDPQGVLQFSVHNDSNAVAESVEVVATWEGGGFAILALGDVRVQSGPHRMDDVPAGVVTLSVSAANVPGETITVRLG